MILPTLRGAIIMAAVNTARITDTTTLTRVLVTRATREIGA